MKRQSVILSPLVLALLLAIASAAHAEITVTNHQDRSTVRYPVILLRGTVPNDADTLEVRVSGAQSESKAVHHEGRFKSLVELREGRNVIDLTAGEESHSIEVNYEPQTNPFYVRLIWMTDIDGDTTFATPSGDVPQDYEARLRTAAQLMQTFTAERMHDLGFGRRTFRLERDADGQIVVHTFKAPKKAEYYYGLQNNPWWFETVRWLNREHDDPYAKNMVLAAFTRKDPDTGRMKAHTALGGNNLGLFGSASVFSWPRTISETFDVFQDATRVDPTRIHDDSIGRSTHWALASTTIGATLHEMVHTFGLMHCADRFGIMKRGFDHFNRFFTLVEPASARSAQQRSFSADEEAYFAPISASNLRWSPWLQLDEQEPPTENPPRIVVDMEARTVTVKAESGVAWIGCSAGFDVLGHRSFQEERPKEVQLSFDEIEKLLGGRKRGEVRAINCHGMKGRTRISLQQ